MDNTKKNGFAITGIILGAVGVIFSFIPFCGGIALICAIVGIVFGALAVGKNQSRNLGLIGLILSIVAAILSIIFMVIAFQKATQELSKQSKDIFNTVKDEIENNAGKEKVEDLIERAEDMIDENYDNYD